MAPILKPIFDILTGDIAVCDNVLCNYLILLVVGEIAYKFAYSFVGDMYRSGAIDGHATGSVLHWVMRFALYALLAYMLRISIWIYNFIKEIPLSVWKTLLIACPLTLSIALHFSFIKKRKLLAKKR